MGMKERGLDRIKDLPSLRLTKCEFLDLLEYSASRPTGIYNKRWKRLDGSHDRKCPRHLWVWMIGEYKILKEHPDKTVTYQIIWYRPVIALNSKEISNG